MRILYDISVLGRGHALPRSRTGVFRTVEEVAIGLGRCSGSAVTFCAGECNFFQCLEYLRSNPQLAGRVLASAGGPLARLRDHVSASASDGDEGTVGWLRYPAVRSGYDSIKGYARP